MNWAFRIFVTIFILLILTLGVLLFAPRGFNEVFFARKSQEVAQSHDIVPLHILAIDFAGYSTKMVKERLEHGDAWFLLWFENDDGRIKTYVFHNLKSLAKYDIDKDGILDIRAPEFKNLHVARFSHRSKTLYHVPINKSGIAAIVLDEDFLVAEILDDPSRYADIAGRAIFYDNSNRELRVVSLSGDEFRGIKLKERSL